MLNGRHVPQDTSPFPQQRRSGHRRIGTLRRHGETAVRPLQGRAKGRRSTPALKSVDISLAALADPTRRELLRRVARGPRRAGDLCRGFRMSRPAVSRHLRVLRNAGLVVAEKRGREQLYRLSPYGLHAVKRCIQQVTEFWDVATLRSR